MWLHIHIIIHFQLFERTTVWSLWWSFIWCDIRWEWYANVAHIDFIKHSALWKKSSVMEWIPAKTLYHRCNVAITRVVVKDKSSGSSLDRFDFAYVMLPIWVPYRGRIFEFRPYKSTVCHVVNFMATSTQHSAQKTQSWVSIFANIIYMSIPA